MPGIAHLTGQPLTEPRRAAQQCHVGFRFPTRVGTMSHLHKMHQRHMRIRRSGLVLAACAVIAFAWPLVAAPMSATAATTSATAHLSTLHGDYVPLRGAQGTGLDVVFTNMDYNGGPV